MKRIIALCLLLLCLFPCVPAAETGEEKQETPVELVEACIDLYAAGQTEEADALLEQIAVSDPELYADWRAVFDCWRELSSSPLEPLLPEGLPDTNELCIVVLGYALKPDGKMREELYKRLDVALACAKQYPNAIIICSGGGTASNAPGVTEAGQMSDWLRKKGVSRDRVIRERSSLTTTENAKFTFRIIEKDHPQVTTVAVVSSDYHVRSGAILLEAYSRLFSEGEPVYHVAACAACEVHPDSENLGYGVSGLKSFLRKTAGK